MTRPHAAAPARPPVEIDLDLAARLVRREVRERTGLFHVEGRLAVERSRDGRRPLLRLFATAEAAAAFPDLAARGLVTAVEPEELAAVSSVKIHEGALGVYARTPDRPEDLLAAPPRCLALLEDVSDPANVAGVLRTATALGAAVLCAGETADPFGARAARASMGAIFHARVALAPDPLRAANSLAAAGFRLVAAVCDGGLPPGEIPRDRPIALALGCEARGLTPALAALCTDRVTIPLPGPVDSLNIAHAAAILAHEFTRETR